MVFRPFLLPETACASYLFGCLTHPQLAVLDPHADLVESYLEEAERLGAPIMAVFETHVQADHVSGLPTLVETTGATAYLPARAAVDFEHVPIRDDEVIELGNTIVHALATPGHAPAHNAYLVGDVGRPDLHAGGSSEPAARQLYASIQRLLELPDHILVYPSHYGGSVCGRGLSGNPFSSIGFERRHNAALTPPDAASFASALLTDVPPAPANQRETVEANRRGIVPSRA